MDNVLGTPPESATRDTLRNTAVIHQIEALGLSVFNLPSDGNC